MADSINGSDNGIFNWDTTTRVPPNTEPSSPDVSSASLITSCSCQVYVNLKKANWDRYRLEVEAALSKCSLPTDCQRDEKISRTILLKAALHYIPTGRHRLHEEPVPAEILDVMTRQDDLRKRYCTSSELLRLNKDIQKCICEHKRQKWRDFVENMDHKTDITKLWRTIKGIDGRERSYLLQRNLVLIVQAVSRQVQQTVQHFKARQTFFFKRNPIGNEGDQEETNGDGRDFHRGHSYKNNQELQK